MYVHKIALFTYKHVQAHCTLIPKYTIDKMPVIPLNLNPNNINEYINR